MISERRIQACLNRWGPWLAKQLGTPYREITYRVDQDDHSGTDLEGTLAQFHNNVQALLGHVVVFKGMAKNEEDVARAVLHEMCHSLLVELDEFQHTFYGFSSDTPETRTLLRAHEHVTLRLEEAFWKALNYPEGWPEVKSGREKAKQDG